MALTNTLLLALCANWPPSNITETTLPPPWKWSKFKVSRTCIVIWLWHFSVQTILFLKCFTYGRLILSYVECFWFWTIFEFSKKKCLQTAQNTFHFYFQRNNKNTIFKSVPYDIYIDILLLNSNIFRTEVERRKLTLILLKLSKYIT